MTVLDVSDQAPPEQSVEEKIAARFGVEQAPQEEAQAPTDDLFELDWEDGNKYQLPVTLKDGFMRQKDYTQKTQETAELRKTYEQAKEVANSDRLAHAFHESIGTEQQELSVIEAYLSQMLKSNWAELSSDQMIRQKIELDNVKERRQAIKDSIAEKRSKFDSDVKTNRAELQRKTRELVSKSIQGFSEETEKSMRQYAASEGLTEAEIDNVLLDPRSFRVIHKAMQFSKVQLDAAKPITSKTGVLKPGPGSERMPADLVAKFNYQKAIAKAKTRGERETLIAQRLEGMFAKRK